MRCGPDSIGLKEATLFSAILAMAALLGSFVRMRTERFIGILEFSDCRDQDKRPGYESDGENIVVTRILCGFVANFDNVRNSKGGKQLSLDIWDAMFLPPPRIGL